VAAITVYIDDSAEERRRRRRRLFEIIILLALIPAVAKMLEAENPPIVRTRVVRVTVYRDKIGSGESQDIPPPPRVAVEPSLLHFAHCDVGSGTPAQLVKIRNAGGHSLDVALRSTGKDFVITDGCGGGPPCTAAVVFAPSAEGRRSGQLLISGNGMTETVQLSGIATARTIGGGGRPDPHLPQHPQPSTTSVSLSGSQCPDTLQPVIEPASVHFTGSGRRTITIRNPHPCPLKITAIDLVNADDPKRLPHGYRLDGDAACKTVLAPQGHCAFKVVTSGIFYTLHARVNIRSVPASTP
jgi:hypothetical protein